MSLSKRIREALQKAVERAGNQLRLEEKTGVRQPAINRFLSGKCSTGNMTVNTLEKLFPDLDITFSRHERLAAIPGLSPLLQKIVVKASELSEDAQLELLVQIGAKLAEGRADAKHQLPNAG